MGRRVVSPANSFLWGPALNPAVVTPARYAQKGRTKKQRERERDRETGGERDGGDGERERDRETGEREGGRWREGETGRERDMESERERRRECVCVSVCVRLWVCEHGWVDDCIGENRARVLCGFIAVLDCEWDAIR